MKKFFSLIALVGVFAACEPENLQTAFTVANATATVQPKALCAAPDFDENDVTFTYGWSNGTGFSTQSITGSPAIEAGSVTVTAHYKGATAETTVSFPKIYAGMNATLTATVVLPYNSGGYWLIPEYDLENAVNKTIVLGLQASMHGHDYAAAQKVDIFGEEHTVFMMQNATEFILEDSYTQVIPEIYHVDDFEVLNDDFAADAFLTYLEDKEDEIIDFDFDTFEFSVSAWSLYNVINPIVLYKIPTYVKAYPVEGSGNPEFDSPVAQYTTTEAFDAIWVYEIAHPDHASHYVPHSGHYTHDGHALHGGNNNAGGGIIEAE